MIELQKLIYFTAIVDNNFNLSRTSENLNISQPTLSLTIEQLEKHYRTNLFIKERNKYVQVTEAGQILYEDAKSMIELSNKTELKIINIQNYSGELKVSLPPVTETVVCSKLIIEFKKKYPNIKLDIFEGGAYIAKQKLIDGDLDFAFLTVVESEELLDGFQIYENDVVAIFRKDHPLVKKKTVLPSDIIKYNIVGLNENFAIYQMIDIYFNNHNTPFSYYLTSSRWDFASELVVQSENNLVTILPSPITKMYHNDILTSRPFKEPLRWKINLSYRKNSILKKEAILFIDFVREFYNIKN